MVQVSFTQNIQRHLRCPDEDCSGVTLREVLEDYFGRHPAARGYVLDEQGVLRHHMIIFVDGQMLSDRVEQSDPLGPASKVHVFQALSGG